MALLCSKHLQELEAEVASKRYLSLCYLISHAKPILEKRKTVWAIRKSNGLRWESSNQLSLKELANATVQLKTLYNIQIYCGEPFEKRKDRVLSRATISQTLYSNALSGLVLLVPPSLKYTSKTNKCKSVAEAFSCLTLAQHCTIYVCRPQIFILTIFKVKLTVQGYWNHLPALVTFVVAVFDSLI